MTLPLTGEIKPIRASLFFVVLVPAVLLVFVALLSLGSVTIPFKDVLGILWGGGEGTTVYERIVLDLRLPRSIAALLAGMALSICGLQMQTLFRNPLADPFVLGISSGAGLGVALYVLAFTGLRWSLPAGLTIPGEFGVVVSAIGGASAVLVLILLVSFRVRNSLTLLIVGIMTGYFTSSIVSILMYFSNPAEIQSYIVWTFGSFRGVTWRQTQVLLPVVIVGAVIAIISIKWLNAMLLGDAYAASLGVRVHRVRLVIIIGTALLAGSVTAFCGPIGFLGIAVPHFCRGWLRTSDHRLLLPATALMGMLIAMLSELFAQLPGSQYSLPLNAVTALFGAPVVVWVVVRQRHLSVS